MAITVEDALVGENAVGSDQVVYGCGVDRAAGSRRRAVCLIVHAFVTNVTMEGYPNNEFARSHQARMRARRDWW
jgi:hypothetical protein